MLLELRLENFILFKVVKGDKTAIVITEIEGNQRLEELTRMLGGDRETARAYAGKLLAGSKVQGSKVQGSGVQGSPKI